MAKEIKYNRRGTICRLPGSVPPTKYSKNLSIYIIKKVTHYGSKTPTWGALQGLSTETVYLCHSANAEGTILAGGSAASPKAPPLRFFVESNATDHQEVSSFFFR